MEKTINVLSWVSGAVVLILISAIVVGNIDTTSSIENSHMFDQVGWESADQILEYAAFHESTLRLSKSAYWRTCNSEYFKELKVRRDRAIQFAKREQPIITIIYYLHSSKSPKRENPLLTRSQNGLFKAAMKEQPGADFLCLEANCRENYFSDADLESWLAGKASVQQYTMRSIVKAFDGKRIMCGEGCLSQLVLSLMFRRAKLKPSSSKSDEIEHLDEIIQYLHDIRSEVTLIRVLAEAEKSGKHSPLILQGINHASEYPALLKTYGLRGVSIIDTTGALQITK